MKQTFLMTGARWIVGLCLLGGWGATLARAEGEPLNETREIVGILKARYVDQEKLDDKQLQDASITGILQALGSGAQILAADQTNSLARHPAAGSGATGPVARAEVIDPRIAYLRVADVTDGASAAVDGALKQLGSAKVNGYILDLRFADGTNYAEAASVASRFVDPGVELFSVVVAQGDPKSFRSAADGSTPRLPTKLSEAPLMVLVNGQTQGSAEALAGALRAQQRCIVIGGKTAGSAAAWEEVKLGDGRRLRLATAKVVLPAAGETAAKNQPPSSSLFPGGVTPDIAVKIDSAVESDLLFHAPTNATLTATLEPRPMKKGLSEAELVKAFKGEAVDTPTANAEETEIQPVRDVVLQRAVDILKGIRVLLSWR